MFEASIVRTLQLIFSSAVIIFSTMPVLAQVVGNSQTIKPWNPATDPFSSSFEERLYERHFLTNEVQYLKTMVAQGEKAVLLPIVQNSTQYTPLLASEPGLKASITSGASEAPKSGAANTNKKNDSKFFGGNFGVGLSYTHDLGSHDRVDSASVDGGGIVRIDDESNGLARLVLESHFFAPCPNLFFGDQNGCGLFVAAQLGDSDSIIDSVGGGLMFGFRPAAWVEEDNNRSFNIGLGVMVDPDTKILGDGINANSALPAGESEVRFKKSTQFGFMILFSYSWL
jgi:hypothetical protein